MAIQKKIDVKAGLLRKQGLLFTRNDKLVAFTLAEVLITLGIIGIVAAMTIPTLVANYQAKSWGTAATVFERKLEEALKTMNTQQSLVGYTTTEEFVAELSKHFKILKTCDNTKLTDCFSDTVYWGGGDTTPEAVDMSTIKTAKHFGQKDWGTNIVGVQFANGTNALIAYNPITHSDDSTVKVCKQDPYSNQITGGDCLAILYDTSGYKSPNTSGKDLRANEHVKSLGSGCAFEIGSTCYATLGFKPEPHVWKACQSDGTSTDPDDIAVMQKYGIRCLDPALGTNDYWAGAVELCGGTDKMATGADLAKIANYVYNTDSVTSTGSTSSLTFDPTKAAELGLPSPDFYLWSGEEGSAYYASSRNFYSTNTLWSRYDRHYSALLAVCVE